MRKIFALLLAMAAFLAADMTALARARHAAADSDSTSAPTQSDPKRRAFIVGIERYSDEYIQGLTRANNDANDLGHDLQSAGFDKKNITIATDIKNKADFNKKFDAFLKTVQEGDLVFFFFSGHGLGVASTGTNYLLFGDLKSPVTYTRGQLPPEERKNPGVVRTKMSGYMDAYETEEIPRNGVSVKEIEQRLKDLKPATAFIVLDACRTLVRSDPDQTKTQHRGDDFGSHLLPDSQLPDGFLILYSASFGENAIEGSVDSNGRNSLFTEQFRSELLRPGQSLVDLAARVKLVVNAIALDSGHQQEPDYYTSKTGGPDDIYFVDTIGERRFEIPPDKCSGAVEDWAKITAAPRREDIDRHIRRFGSCNTAEIARQRLVSLTDSLEDAPTLTVLPSNHPIDPCDKLAASDTDRARPPEVPGVIFADIEPNQAIATCKDSIAKSPRIVRFLFNLGRAEMQLANSFNPKTQQDERTEAFRQARLAYDDAQSRGYVAAVYNLGVIYDLGLGVDPDAERANELFKRAAHQGFPLAMYTLGQRYKSGGKGFQRRDEQAYEWFAKASDSGLVDATVEVGEDLWSGAGVKANPIRAIEKLQSAAEAGSKRAKRLLGKHYYLGSYSQEDNVFPADPALALLWFGRAAETNDADAQYYLAQIMEAGSGLPKPQPEIAERYWRFAAYGGNEDAEIAFAKRLETGRMLVKPENGEGERVELLHRAVTQGSARAALELAKVYRTGTAGIERDPIQAMRYAYQTIKFATKASPTTEDGNPFHEIAAGILLVEMAHNGEAVGANGEQLLSKDEIDRLELFYGKVDPDTNKVKVRELWTQLTCYFYYDYDERRQKPKLTPQSYSFWVWDWGRDVSPTEGQFRSLEFQTGCRRNKDLRDTLTASFQLAKKDKVAYADLIEQQIKIAADAKDPVVSTRRRRYR